MVKDLDPMLEQSDIKAAGVSPMNKKRFSVFLSPKAWIIITRVTVGLVIIILPVYLILVRPLLQFIVTAKAAVIESKKIMIALQDQDLDGAKRAAEPAKQKLAQVDRELQYFAFTKNIPLLGGFYQDGSHAVRAGAIGLDSVSIIVDILTPYADLLGLKGKGNFMGGSAQERFQKVVQTVDKVLPSLDRLAPQLKAIRAEVDQIDANHYPQGFGLNLKSQVASVKTLVQQAEAVVVEARPALEVLPQVMGQPVPKRYLVLFQNDKELRPSGGFLTAYTYLVFDHGKVQATGSDDIYNLDTRLHSVCLHKVCNLAPPAPILRYLPESDGKPKTAWDSRDANLSPDWKVSAQSFERFYNIIGGPPLDGVIAIDTNVIKEMLGAIGPVRVGGYNTVFTKDNVVDELVNYSTVVFKGSTGRKQVLGDLMYSIMQYILQSGRSKIPDLLDVGVKLGNEKHILVYLHDEKSQSVAEQFNWAGRIVDTTGDYLAVNDANFAGGKANLFVVEKVDQKITVTSDGTIEKTVTIDYDNPRAFHPDLNPTYRTWVRLFVPKGSTLTGQQGSQQTMIVSEDLGKTVFEGYMIVPPKQKKQLVVSYRLPFKANASQDYQLLIQKQPGTDAHSYSISINGKPVGKPFPLLTDRQLRLSL